MRFISAVAFAFLTSLAVAGTAAATAIYSYTGNNFTSIVDNDPPPGAYTTSMKVSGTFTMASPIAPNILLEDLSASVLDYSFHDGRHTLTASNSNVSALFITTDSSGIITEWGIEVIEILSAPVATGDFRVRLGTANFQIDETRGALFDEARLEECLTASGGSCTTWDTEGIAADQGRVGLNVGSLTLIPEPSTALLLGSGLLALAAARRRAL